MTTSSATPCGRPPARPASRRSGRFLRCGDGALPVNRPDEPLGLADFSVNARPSFMFRGAVGQIASLGISLRSEEHTSELQSLMRISYAVFCLKKKKNHHNQYFIIISITHSYTLDIS